MTDKNIILPITGMTCTNCAQNIERTLKKLDGMNHISVNFAVEQASVNFDDKKIALKDIVDKIKKTGFDVPLATSEFPVPGMNCINCTMNIERTLNKNVDGIIKGSVNFATERILVEDVPSSVSLDDILHLLKKQDLNPSRLIMKIRVTG